jgi:hypothetical protein
MNHRYIKLRTRIVALEIIYFFVAPPPVPGSDILDWIQGSALRRVSHRELFRLLTGTRREREGLDLGKRELAADLKYAFFLDLYSRRAGFASFGDCFRWSINKKP